VAILAESFEAFWVPGAWPFVGASATGVLRVRVAVVLRIRIVKTEVRSESAHIPNVRTNLWMYARVRTRGMWEYTYLPDDLGALMWSKILLP